jgi:hypothetical protein
MGNAFVKEMKSANEDTTGMIDEETHNKVQEFGFDFFGPNRPMYTNVAERTKSLISKLQPLCRFTVATGDLAQNDANAVGTIVDEQ